MLWNAKNDRVPLREGAMPYVSFGNGPRKLIILPGLSDGLATVQGKALLLAGPYRPFFQDFTVYMFSRKEPLPSNHSIRDMAADQAEALEALGLQRVSVLGVSEGGMVAQYLAIDHPELVEKLVLAVTAPCMNDLIRSCLSGWMDMAGRGNHGALMIDTAERSYSPTYLKNTESCTLFWATWESPSPMTAFSPMPGPSSPSMLLRSFPRSSVPL